MRRRLHLAPFETVFPEERRDRNLTKKLQAEAGGVLGWMLEGCAAWRERGLDPPSRVREAAATYFEDEDVFGQWIAEQCRVGPEECSTSQDLFTNWSAYAEAGGHRTGSKKALADELRSRGYEAVRTNQVRGWRGIAVGRVGDGP